MLDISNIKVLDFHAHVPWAAKLSELIDGWAFRSLDLVMSTSDYTKMKEAERTNDKTTLRDLEEKYDLNHLRQKFREQFKSLAFMRGLTRYIAQVYRLKPDLDQIDELILRKAKEDMIGYIRSILDRENIETVLLNVGAGVEIKDFPKDRYKSVIVTTDFIQPDWANSKNAEDLDQVMDLIDNELKYYAKRGCAGFKSLIGYYRGWQIDKVDPYEANIAYKSLLETKPARYTVPVSTMRAPLSLLSDEQILFHGAPVYKKSEDMKNLKTLNDFLIHHILIRSGEHKLPFLFHPCGNPKELSPMLSDDKIKNTTIVLLHTVYPYYREASGMVLSFPNLYVDISWHMGHPAVFHEIMKTFLETSLSQKFLYGSDATTVAERLAWSAWSAKKVMKDNFEEFIDKYGWTKEECLEAAENILNKNAKRILKLH